MIKAIALRDTSKRIRIETAFKKSGNRGIAAALRDTSKRIRIETKEKDKTPPVDYSFKRYFQENKD